MEWASWALTTPSRSMSDSIAILRFSSSGIGRSARHTSTSGWIPIDRSSRTECWAGLVFSSLVGPMKGTRAQWT